MALIDVKEVVTTIKKRQIKLDRKQFFKMVELAGGPGDLSKMKPEVTLEVAGEDNNEFVTLFDNDNHEIVLRWEERTQTER